MDNGSAGFSSVAAVANRTHAPIILSLRLPVQNLASWLVLPGYGGQVRNAFSALRMTLAWIIAKHARGMHGTDT
jgi:hypothetical protein